MQIGLLRDVLNSNKDLNKRVIFQQLDQNQKECISISDLDGYLKSKKINFQDLVLREFVRQYDRDNDLMLNFEEFHKIKIGLKIFLRIKLKLEQTTQMKTKSMKESSFRLSNYLKRNYRPLNH